MKLLRVNRGSASFETSFDSKQPKLEPKLVSALYETKRLFRCFETKSFGVAIEPKQTEEQPKQFEREDVFVFYSENSGLLRFVWKQFVSVVSLLYQNRVFGTDCDQDRIT